MRAVGAEAMQESVIEQAEDDGWSKLEWYVARTSVVIAITPLAYDS